MEAIHLKDDGNDIVSDNFRLEINPGQESLLSPEQLEYIRTRSRLLFYGMPQTKSFMGVRRTQGGGQKTLVDERVQDSGRGEFRVNLSGLLPQVNASFQVRGLDNVLRASEINRAVSVVSIIRKEQVVEQVTEGRFFKKTVTRETGETKITPRLMNEFSEDSSAQSEPACLLTYHITGTPNQEFKDMDTNRSGRMAFFSLVLPESDIKPLYERMVQNPHTLDQIFEYMDPDLMNDQKTAMPGGNKIFIKPIEGDPYEFDSQNTNVLKGIKAQYIREY